MVGHTGWGAPAARVCPLRHLLSFPPLPTTLATAPQPRPAPSSDAHGLGGASNRSRGGSRRCPRGSLPLVLSSNAAGSMSLVLHFAPVLIFQFLKILGFDHQGDEWANASRIERLQLCWGSCCAAGLGGMSAACFAARGFAKAAATSRGESGTADPNPVRLHIAEEQSPLVRPNVHPNPRLVPTSSRCHGRRVRPG